MCVCVLLGVLGRNFRDVIIQNLCIKVTILAVSVFFLICVHVEMCVEMTCQIIQNNRKKIKRM